MTGSHLNATNRGQASDQPHDVSNPAAAHSSAALAAQQFSGSAAVSRPGLQPRSMKAATAFKGLPQLDIGAARAAPKNAAPSGLSSADAKAASAEKLKAFDLAGPSSAATTKSTSAATTDKEQPIDRQIEGTESNAATAGIIGDHKNASATSLTASFGKIDKLSSEKDVDTLIKDPRLNEKTIAQMSGAEGDYRKSHLGRAYTQKARLLMKDTSPEGKQKMLSAAKKSFDLSSGSYKAEAGLYILQKTSNKDDAKAAYGEMQKIKPESGSEGQVDVAKVFSSITMMNKPNTSLEDKKNYAQDGQKILDGSSDPQLKGFAGPKLAAVLNA